MRPIDAEALLKKTINNPLHAPYIVEKDIRGMPTIQPEPSHTQKSCEYCHEDSDGYTRPIEKNCHAYIRFGMNGWELDLKAKRMAW